MAWHNRCCYIATKNKKLLDEGKLSSSEYTRRKNAAKDKMLDNIA